MTSAINQLKAIAQTPPPSLTGAANRIMALTGLPVEHGSAPDPDVTDHRAALAHLADPLDIPALLTAFQEAFDSPAFSARGYRTYRVPFEIMMRPVETSTHDPRTSAEALMPYETAWRANRACPSTSAVFAIALATVAASIKARVDDDDDEDTEAEACYDRARSILDDTETDAPGNWLWHRADLSVAFLGCCLDVEDLQRLELSFTALQDLDPYEFGIYEDRAGQLLPRWFGSSAALAHFAKSALARTKSKFGATLYARIYNAALHHATLAELDPNLTQLHDGFADWLARFPSQPLANRAAVIALSTGNDALLRDLFRNHIRTIHLDQWAGDNQVRKAWLLATRRNSRR